METFFTALLVFLFIVFGIVFIGFYLMSKMVGGFGNLKAIYRLFTGRGMADARPRTAKSSSSGSSSYTYNNKGQASGGDTRREGKMFGQHEGTYVDFEEVKDS